MLTAKGKYGLKALTYLATLQRGETAQASDIAASNNISKKFLDAILADLRRAGFVRAKKGPGGGYMLARASSEIKIGNAIRALDGPLAPIACASRTAYQPCEDCPNPRACRVRITMTKVRDAMSQILDNTTLADMAPAKEYRIADSASSRRRSGVSSSLDRVTSAHLASSARSSRPRQKRA